MAVTDAPIKAVAMPVWSLSVALVSVLFLIYASSFTMDYLALDELAFVGRAAADYDHYYQALAHGRPLAVTRPFVYAFADYDPVKIQFVRFASFAFFASIASILFRFLCRESGRPFFSFFTTLFLFSQLPFQGMSGFSLDLISSFVQPMCLSLAAFWLHFFLFPKWNVRRWRANGVVLLILFAAMQSGQTWAFFAMVPLSYLVLAGTWERFRQARDFILLAAASIAISVVTYKIGLAVLHDQGREGYAVGESAMEAMSGFSVSLILHAINPRTYWSAFKLWTYPFPFHNTPESLRLREGLALSAIVAWSALVLAAIATQLRARRAEKGLVAAKWLAGLSCLGFGAFVILGDSPFETTEARPHLTLVLSGICIFIGSYALLVLSERFALLRSGAAKAAAIALVLLTAFGAQSGMLKGYVDNRGDQLDFIRTELSARAPEQFDRIVVVFAPRDWICLCEPCDRYSGKVVHFIWHARRPERYKYAMKTIGIPPESKQIVFVEGAFEAGERDLVIDWGKFFRARKSYVDSFPWSFPFKHRRVSEASAEESGQRDGLYTTLKPLDRAPARRPDMNLTQRRPTLLPLPQTLPR